MALHLYAICLLYRPVTHAGASWTLHRCFPAGAVRKPSPLSVQMPMATGRDSSAMFAMGFNTSTPVTDAYASFPSFPEIEALLRLQDRLLNVSRLATVGEMSSGIAHELNQPLCAMANYAQACDRLLTLPNPDLAEIRESLQQITSQALRAGAVIQRLRTLARPQ